MRFFTLLLALCLSTPILAEAPPPRDHITIDLHRPWLHNFFSASSIKSADRCDMDLSGEHPKFICDEAGARAIFGYEFHLPIEMTTYPTFVLKYRATNIDTNNTWTCIWIYEGERDAIYPLIDFDKLTVDGKEHEIQVDLPTAPTGNSGTPFGSGPVKGLLVSVMNKEGGEGSIELISAQFRSADQPPRAAQNDDPIRVHVVDDDEKAVKGAQVTVDAERKDSAQSATTDEKGMATLAPIKNEISRHTLHVEAAGEATADLDSVTADPAEIKLTKAMQLGGFIEDENGKPLGNAWVHVLLHLPLAVQDPLLPTYSPIATSARTNDRGQWLAPPMPWSDQIELRVAHADYDPAKLSEADISIDELRSGIATVRLKK